MLQCRTNTDKRCLGCGGAEEQGAAAAPPSQPNLPPLPTPVPSHGQGSASPLQGCLFRRGGGFARGLETLQRLSPARRTCARGLSPATLHMLRRIWQQRWYPGSRSQFLPLPQGTELITKSLMLELLWLHPPSVKQRAFPPLSCTYPVEDPWGLGAPWSRTST